MSTKTKLKFKKKTKLTFKKSRSRSRSRSRSGESRSDESRSRSDSKTRSKKTSSSDFMYYPDIESEFFYEYLWSKQEFLENKSEPQEYYTDPKKRMALLKRLCTADVLKLKKHQIFLRNYLSPETPYNGLLIFHGVGTGKCLLPESLVYVNGREKRIDEIWDHYRQYGNGLVRDHDGGEWSDVNTGVWVNSFDGSTGLKENLQELFKPGHVRSKIKSSLKLNRGMVSEEGLGRGGAIKQTLKRAQGRIINCPVRRLYRQHIDEDIRDLYFSNGKRLRMTMNHHLLLEGKGWSNQISVGDFVASSDFCMGSGVGSGGGRGRGVGSVEWVEVTEVHVLHYCGYVYDLEVDTHHNYVANGIICHNTCGAVTIAEGLKDTVEKYGKKIYVIATGLLQGNFQSTLYNASKENYEKYPGSLQCTKTTYYIPPKKKESVEERRVREKAIKEMQKKYYTFMGYTKFVNFVQHEVLSKKLDLREFFSHSVFVVDEAHNLIAKSGTQSKDKLEEHRKAREMLETVLKEAGNTTLILLSATPITNEISDIIVLINLLRVNDGRRKYSATELSTDGSAFLTKDNLDKKKFDEFTKGYISFFRGAHPSVFPVEMTQNVYDRKIKYDLFGDDLPRKLTLKKGVSASKSGGVLTSGIPDFKDLGLVTCEMSDFHFYNYFRKIMQLEKNSIDGVRSRDSQGDQGKIQAGTAYYPLEDTDRTLGTFELDDVMIKTKGRGKGFRYKYRTKEEFLAVADSQEENLHREDVNPQSNNEVGYPLAKYSAKMYHLFRDIVNNFGINFIFTRYKTKVGTIAMSIMLEQNGYVRYHDKLGPPNEFTGKYREGVNNLLDTRNIKYRCICGYLDTEHTGKFSSEFDSESEGWDWTNPKKHKFLQGTYLRVDGDMTEIEFEFYRKKLNHISNKHGGLIKVIVGGQNMREGVDLMYVRSVHIMNPWHNLIQIEQTIGRAIRMCSHAQLDSPNEMDVRVYKYCVVPPQRVLGTEYRLDELLEEMEDSGAISLRDVNFRNKSDWLDRMAESNPKDWLCVDEYVYARALNKDYNIKYAERLMKKNSVDCYLNHQANLSFPGQQDGSRDCDYQDCEYQCNYNFKEPKSPNIDTYDLYFMEPKVMEAQELITNLFSSYWALTLQGIMSLVRKDDDGGRLSEDIIYLALDRILGDPPVRRPVPVRDQYGRNGYIIYRHPYYLFQPNEVSDEGLPLENRKYPSKANPRQVEMGQAIAPKKKTIVMKKPLKKTSISDRVGDGGESRGESSEFANKMENLLAPLRSLDQSGLENHLDYFDKEQHEYLIRSRIEEIMDGERKVSKFDQMLITYYVNIFVLYNTLVKFDSNDRVVEIPNEGEWVYGLSNKFWHFDSSTKKWVEVHEDDKIMIEAKKVFQSSKGPSLNRLDRDLSSDMYGYIYDDNKKKELKFKIADIKGQKVKKKKHSEDVNINTRATGQVCINFGVPALSELCDRLGLKVSATMQRNQLCSLIENELRERDRMDNSTVWFMNFHQYQRHFSRYDHPDSRTLFRFLSGS